MHVSNHARWLNTATWRGLALMVGAWLPALLGAHVVGQVAGLYALSQADNPYFVPSHAWLLYAVTPVVVTSGFALFLSPGALLSRFLGRPRGVAEWLLQSFSLSLVATFVLGTLAKLVLPGPLGSRSFIVAWAALTLGLAIVLPRTRKAMPFAGWSAPHQERRRLYWLAGVAVIATAALLPKLFWENFNLDGIEAYEYGRSLTHHVLPYWHVSGGRFGFYQNFLLFAYPNHWFLSLFGPYEATARIPFVLYVLVVFAALTLLIEHGRDRGLRAREELLLWVGLVLFGVVQVYSTNYEPFFADIAEMAATDTLWVAVFLGAVLALWERRSGWFLLLSLMTYLASPGGLAIIGALAVAMALIDGVRAGSRFRLAVVAVAIAVGCGAAYESIYVPLVLGGVSEQFSAFNLVKRIYPPTLTEFARWNALIFPSGVLPALAIPLALWRRTKDPLSWSVAVAMILYFGLLYIQTWTALHQFTPLMVMPLVIWWRFYLDLRPSLQRSMLLGLGATTAAALMLSLPQHWRIDQRTRLFGYATSFEVGDYEQDYATMVRHADNLYHLIPGDYRLRYPEQPWGTDPLAVLYYASRQKTDSTVVNYFVRRSGPPPEGAREVGRTDDVVVYVRDETLWQSTLRTESNRVVASPLYEPILRHTYSFFRAFTEARRGS